MAAQIRPLEAMTEEEKKKVSAPAELWTDSFASKVAKADIDTAMRYREINHEWRYRTAMELYVAWVQQKMWEGSRQQRSSLGVYVAFSLIESLIPKMQSSTFSDPEWFDVAAEPGSTADEAKAAMHLMLHQMKADPRANWVGVQEIVRRARKSSYIFGNGVVELFWKAQDIEKWRWNQQFVPVVAKRKSLIGMVNQVVDTKRVFNRTKQMERVNAPRLGHVSIFDAYADPNCPSPNANEGRYFFKRRFMEIDELLKYKDTPGFKIPDKATLLQLAKDKPIALAETAKRATESVRGNTWAPELDSTADPAGSRLEVIPYYTKERVVWMANRELCLFNQPNGLGFIPFFTFFYADVLDRWYSLGICDVVEGDQRFQQQLLNGRIDELALALHPSTIKRRGTNMPMSAMRRRPGNVVEVQDPTTDIVREEVSNVTQTAYLEQQFSELRVQKTVGLSDLFTSGTPNAGGNSANRTATGIGAQTSASGSRVEGLVEVDQDTVIEPILYCWHQMNKQFLDPAQVRTILGPEGKNFTVNAMDVKNAEVAFAMRASAKMKSKAALLQVWPTISQILLNPGYLQAVSTINGMKVNLQLIGQVAWDMSGYQSKWGDLFLPLTQQDMARMQQPAPADLIKDKMQDKRMAAMQQMQEEKLAAEMMHTAGEKLLDGVAGQSDSQGTEEPQSK